MMSYLSYPFASDIVLTIGIKLNGMSNNGTVIKKFKVAFKEKNNDLNYMVWGKIPNKTYDGRIDNLKVTKKTDILHKYPSDYRVVIVGDAAMSPYEVTMKGGSVEHWNEESGAIWLKRLCEVYDHVVWINPTQKEYWKYSQSTQLIGQIIGEHRMFPMTLTGIEEAMKELAR